MRKTNSGLVSLDKAAAEEILRRYVGPNLSVVGATTTSAAAIFMAKTGCLEVRCENDWYEQNGRLKVTMQDPLGGSALRMYFHPETLERDYKTEEAKKLETVQNDRREWVLTQGPTHCHQMVDRLWEGG